MRRAVTGLTGPVDPTRRSLGHRVLRSLVLITILALTVVLVPDAGTPRIDATLVRVVGAQAVDAETGVVWILALGSDARPGEPVLSSRADAIQLVGIDTGAGRAVVIGIPRDSYVEIPGYGSDKINSSMVYGGPQLMARSVADLVGLTPDYVFTTSFWGIRNMVSVLDGVRVYSPYAWSIPAATVRSGMNSLDGGEAIAFARMRHELPGGDFDRSRDQGYLLKGALRRVRTMTQDPGALERLLVSFLRNVDITLPPDELYRLARAVLQVRPERVQICQVDGTTGYVGAASVVHPDVAQARSLVDRARGDARVEGGC